MSLKKDKEKVLDEQFDEGTLRRFLAVEGPGKGDRDYHILERAYRGLQAQDFERFLSLFCEEKHNLNAVNEAGQTLAEAIAGHRFSAPYCLALEKAAG